MDGVTDGLWVAETVATWNRGLSGDRGGDYLGSSAGPLLQVAP